MGFVTRFAGKNRRMRKRLHFRQRLVRSLHIIPNLFTLGNAFFGFCSIILAAHGNIVGAAYFILMGALMDGLDGRVARFMKISSDFGTQLDSLCDTVTFCLAPSILLYFWELKKLGVLGVVIAGMFLLSGILRLARFNITHDEQFIISTGVTTTVAACFVASLALTLHEYLFLLHEQFALLALVLALSWLMVSTVPFPTFKELSRTATGISIGIGLAFIITMGLTTVLLYAFIAYFLYSLGRAIAIKIRTPKA